MASSIAEYVLEVLLLLVQYVFLPQALMILGFYPRKVRTKVITSSGSVRIVTSGFNHIGLLAPKSTY